MQCFLKLFILLLFSLVVGFYSIDSSAQTRYLTCPTDWTPTPTGGAQQLYLCGDSGYSLQCASTLVGYYEGFEINNGADWYNCQAVENGVDGCGFSACISCERSDLSYRGIALSVSHQGTLGICDDCLLEDDYLATDQSCDLPIVSTMCNEETHCEYERKFSASSCGYPDSDQSWWATYEPTGDKCIPECDVDDFECLCDEDPDIPGCAPPFCEQYPDSPLCDDPDFCDENPNHPLCIDDDDDKGFCDRNPDHPGCAEFCDRNPWHPACVEVGDFCEENPYHVRCNDEPDEEDFCEKYPFHPVCIDPGEFCDDYPYHPSCQDDRPFCERYPESPACSNNLCEEFPEHPYCDDEEYCDKFPGDPLCLDCGNPDNEDPRCHVPYCDLYPDTPECRDSGDFCQQPGNQHSMWCIGCDDPAQSQQPWCQNQIPCYGEGCNEENGGFAIGSSCDKGQPICSDDNDPVGCALLWQVWYSSCGPEAGGSIPFGDPGLVVAGLPTDAEVESEIDLMLDGVLSAMQTEEQDVSDLISGESFLPQSCPSPYDLNLMGASVTVPLDPICDLATAVRPMVIAMFFIFSALIVVRAF